MPLDYMPRIMRDANADNKRRDAMAMAAAPYVYPKLSAIEAKLTPGLNPDGTMQEERGLRIEFVVPTRRE